MQYRADGDDVRDAAIALDAINNAIGGTIDSSSPAATQFSILPSNL